MENIKSNSSDKEDVFKAIVDNMREGVYITDREKIISFWSKGAEAITGYRSNDVLGSSCQCNILAHIDNEGRKLCDHDCPLTASIRGGKTVEVEAYLHHKKGHRLPVHIRTAPVLDNTENIIGACEIFADISSKITVEKKLTELKKLAMIDPLTELANRRYIDHSLAKRMEEAQTSDMKVGIIFYDIDHFKKINDNYGHHIGDKVIKMVANTLLKSSRSLDVVGRWGGEEMIEIIPNVTEEYFQMIAERNRMLVENSDLQIASDDLKVTVSVGATIIRKDDSLDSFLERADKLMYKSKKEGRNRVSFG